MNAVFQLVTVPLVSALHAPYPREERTPPASYKNEDAIARWYETDEAKWADTRHKKCALNPRLGRVAAVGFHRPDTGTTLCYAESEATEREAIQEAWATFRLARGNGVRPVTWNGEWALRFLVARSIVLRVTPSMPQDVVRGWLKKYGSDEHFDVKAALVGHDSFAEGEGLNEWAAAFGSNEWTWRSELVVGDIVRGDHAAAREEVRKYLLTLAALYNEVGPWLDPRW